MTDWKRLLAYDAWANCETLASVKAAGNPPPEALRWLGHLVGAGRIWLSRLEGGAAAPPPVWPALSLQEAEAGLEELAARWRNFLSRSDGTTPSRTVTYTNSKGEPWTSSVDDIVTHVTIHGGYHRGQIAVALRAAGFTPAYTDFIEAARRGALGRA